MSFYVNFLKVFGFRGAISKSLVSRRGGEAEDDENVQMQEIVVDVDSDFNIQQNVVDQDRSFFRSTFFRIVVNTLYRLLIVGSLVWPAIYAIYKAFENSEARYLTSNVFTVMFIVQYFVGLFYYQTNHFFKTMKRNLSYSWYIKTALIVGIVISTILTIVSVILLNIDYNLDIYTELFNGTNTVGKVLISVLLALDKFFSYNVFFINLVIFSAIFIIHSREIKRYTSRLEDYVNNNEDGLTIESITKDYSELKTQHTQSVTQLNNIFSSVTIFGIIGSYFITVNFETFFVGPLHYIDACSFLVTECAYIYSISRVKLSVSDIKSIINSPRFVSRYLSRVYLQDFTGEIISTQTSDSSPVHDKADIKMTLKRAQSLKQNSSEKKKIDFIKDITMRTMIKGHENAEGIDWVILNDKLGGSWENFKLMGFDIDDDTLIKKTSAVVVGLIMLLHLNNIFGF